jgi:threonine dehydrogenase-like Zn-dependent dehydrogenase
MQGAVPYAPGDIRVEDRPAIKDLTGGLRAHSVIEAVGTQESMMSAAGCPYPS